jgi:hypothetical protein
VLPYNDLSAVQTAFEEQGDAIACVITEAAVEHEVGVVHLAVAQEVDGRAHARSLPQARSCAVEGWRTSAVDAAAAARAAWGRASATRSRAASSWAAETNQDSYADGGR